MIKPDFSKLSFDQLDWNTKTKTQNTESFMTPEDIPVKEQYSTDDIKEAKHIGFSAGLPPFFKRTLFGHVCFQTLDD